LGKAVGSRKEEMEGGANEGSMVRLRLFRCTYRGLHPAPQLSSDENNKQAMITPLNF